MNIKLEHAPIKLKEDADVLWKHFGYFWTNKRTANFRTRVGGEQAILP